MNIIGPLPNIIAAGDPVSAGPVMANFNTIVSDVNQNAYSGASGVKQLAPGVPPTGFAVTNPFSFQVTVYIIGGTFTDVFIAPAPGSGGILIGGPVRTVLVPANGAVGLVYTVAPTWAWFS